ncbi:MAG: GyrI-like domain-containing protein [Bacillota bacterium]
MAKASEKMERVEMGQFKIVGFRVLCPGDQYIKEIERASYLLEKGMSEIKHIETPHLQVGAFQVEESTEEEDGYWIGMKVSEYEDVPENMDTLTIPAQAYAVLHYQGSNGEIRQAYKELHTWIEANGLKRLKEKWHLELYHSWKDNDSLSISLCDTVE